MVKVFVLLVLGLLLVSSVSAYYCIRPEDNDAVKQFKSNMNILALKNDIATHRLTEEAFNIKIKLFNPCNEYLGPVRPNDDEEYYRDTGITRRKN